MNRRQALSHLARSLGLRVLARWPSLSGQTDSDAATEATITLKYAATLLASVRDEEDADIAGREYQRFLPPLVKPPQQPLVFPAIVGKQAREPISNTVIECVSNNPGYAHDYSISSPENADGTLLMLHNYSEDTSDTTRNQDIIVHAKTLALYRDKQYSLGNHRRWSYTDPDTLYCIPNDVNIGGTTNILNKYHPSTDRFEVLYDFPAKGFSGWTISFGQGGGTQDWNDRFMPISAINGSLAKMIVFDLQLGAIHSQVDWSTLLTRDGVNIPNSVKGDRIPSADGEDASFTMSRDGNYCVVFRGGDDTPSFPSMYEVYDSDWTNRRECGALDSSGDWATMHFSHATTGVDLQGNQVICGENQPGEHHYITIDTPNIEFIHYPAKAWGHTSTSPGLRGYVACYGYDVALEDPYFDGTIAMVLCPLDKTSDAPAFNVNDHGLPMYSGMPPSDMRQYGYHRSKGVAYTSQPHVALTTRGDKAYFVSNHSGQSRGYRIFADEKSAT